VKRADQRPSAELRQELILELQRSSNISQRALARRLGLALGTVNRFLNDMIAAGYVRVFNRTVRPYAYVVTDDGEQYQRRLSHEHYSWVLSHLQRLEQRIRSTLGDLRRQGVKRVVLYGAGEVMEATHRVACEVGLHVVGVVDDDAAQQGLRMAGLVVEPPSAINTLAPDAVLVTTFHHSREIQLALNRELRSPTIVWEL